MLPFLVSALASALLTIAAVTFGWRRAVYVFKPLTTGLIICLAVLQPDPVSLFYRNAIGLGLICSLVGDVFLMLPKDRFVPGLAAFLVAHLCYITAFASVFQRFPAWGAALLLVWGVILIRSLWPHLGRLRIAVTVYSTLLLVMAFAAAGGWRSTETRTILATIGAFLFVGSDSVLALQRFVRRRRWGHLFVLSTYFSAQLLIALSVRAR